MRWYIFPRIFWYKAFRHVETLFLQGNQVRTDQNKPPFLVIKKKLTIVNLFFITKKEGLF